MMRIARLVRIHLVALRFGLDEFLLGHERVRGLRPFVNRVLFWRDLSQPRGVRLREALQALGPDLRQVRADAVDAARPAAARHRRRAGQAAGSRAAVSRRAGAGHARARLRQAGRPGLQVVRPDAGGERLGGAGAFRRAPGRHAGRREGAAARHPQGHRARPGADADRRGLGRDGCGPTASGCGRARWSPNSRRRSATSSTSRARPPTARSFAAISSIRRCCWCRKSTGTGRSTEVLVMERMAGIPIGRIDELQRAGIDLQAAVARPAWRSSSRRCSATASSTPTCIRATSSSPPTRRTTASTSRSTSASWARCRRPTRATSRRISSRSSAATTIASRRRTSSPAGCRRTRASTSSRRKSASCASRSSTGRCGRSRSARCWCRCSARRAASTSQIQPQLTLLQKTLLNVEGLGRQLDPDLDLWVTAKPFLERWMQDQIGLPALQRRLLAEAPYIVAALPELPRLLHQRLLAPPAASDIARSGARRRRRSAQPLAGRDRGAAASSRSSLLLRQQI